MKVPFLLLVLALCPRIIFAQNPVPNSSFELWMDNEPFDWFTSNLPDQAGDERAERQRLELIPDPEGMVMIFAVARFGWIIARRRRAA